MMRIQSIGYVVAIGAGLSLAARADTNIVITSFHGNGELVWQGSNMTSYTVQWAPSPNGPWNNSWSALADIPAHEGPYTSSVPMFYRVMGWQGPASILLIHGDGTNGATDFAEQNGHPVTAYGGVQISTNESKFGGASIYFDGSGSYLSLAQSADWAFSTNDFTVDLWLRITSASATTIQFVGCHLAYSHADWFLTDYGTTLSFMDNAGQFTSDFVPAVDTWYHFAATRAGGVLRLFVNGVKKKEQALPDDLGCSLPLTIGRADNDWGRMTGYMDEIRIIKGTAAWTNDFIPPAVPYAR